MTEVPTLGAKAVTSFKIYSAPDLVGLKLPPRSCLLGPWLPECGLTMIYAKRGVGKTHLALAIALAVATGTGCLGWVAPSARKVLVVDGEMGGVDLKDRLSRMAVTPDNLHYLAADLQDRDLPDLASREGQDRLWAVLQPYDLVVFDNLASLCQSGDENDAESWRQIQSFLARLKRAGKSVLIIHHAGKSGAQRGTSAREDIMDAVLCLEHPDNYSPDQGARFEIRFEKARHLRGADAEAFEATLESDGTWTRSDLSEPVDIARMRALQAEGKSTRDIGVILGVAHTTVSRKLRREA